MTCIKHRDAHPDKMDSEDLERNNTMGENDVQISNGKHPGRLQAELTSTSRIKRSPFLGDNRQKRTIKLNRQIGRWIYLDELDILLNTVEKLEW